MSHRILMKVNIDNEIFHRKGHVFDDLGDKPLPDGSEKYSDEAKDNFE